MDKIIVLGSRGMLGNEVARTLVGEGYEVRRTQRVNKDIQGVLRFDFDGTSGSVREFFSSIKEPSMVVNCIGLIPQKTSNANQNRDFISLNTMLPSFLDRAADEFGFKVIQIATDCVFSGKTGLYSEESPHDATDLYGITKSLGEINTSNFLNLRCSIIGSEIGTSVSLRDWLLNHRNSAELKGYVDHLWNGITTKGFAKIVSGILRGGNFFSGTRHIIPGNYLSKFELLKIIAKSADRNDLIIREFESGQPIDRRLVTRYPECNQDLWKGAGYTSIPNLDELIEEFEKMDRDHK